MTSIQAVTTAAVTFSFFRTAQPKCCFLSSASPMVQVEDKSANPAAYEAMVPVPFGNIIFPDIERNSSTQSSILENLFPDRGIICPRLGHR